MNAPSPDKSSRQYGDAFEFWWAAAGLAHACKPEAWEAWKASARRPDEPAARPSLAAPTDAVSLTVLALDRMIESVHDDIGEADVRHNDALLGELKGLQAARTYLQAATKKDLAALSPLATTEPVDPESEAANPVWDLVVAKCRKAWPQTKGPICWNESPLELITQIINERDEAYETAAALCDGAGSDAGRIVGSKLAERIRELKGTSAVSHTEAPLTTLLAWAVGERSSWEGNNADRHWQMNRVVGQIEDAIASAPPSATRQKDELAWLIACKREGVLIGWFGLWDNEDFGWTLDPNKAIRFARQQDAEAVRSHWDWDALEQGDKLSTEEHMWL